MSLKCRSSALFSCWRCWVEIWWIWLACADCIDERESAYFFCLFIFSPKTKTSKLTQFALRPRQQHHLAAHLIPGQFPGRLLCASACRFQHEHFQPFHCNYNIVNNTHRKKMLHKGHRYCTCPVRSRTALSNSAILVWASRSVACVFSCNSVRFSWVTFKLASNLCF